MNMSGSGTGEGKGVLVGAGERENVGPGKGAQRSGIKIIASTEEGAEVVAGERADLGVVEIA